MFEEKDGKLVKIKPILEPLWKLSAVKIYLTDLEYKIRLAPEKHDKNFDLLKKYLISSKEILQQHVLDQAFDENYDNLLPTLYQKVTHEH